MCFVRLLKHWYKEQTMQMKWAKHVSEPFHVSNGVRQGGVLSPVFFLRFFEGCRGGALGCQHDFPFYVGYFIILSFFHKNGSFR